MAIKQTRLSGKTTSCCWTFSMSIFDLKQTCKKVLTEKCSIWKIWKTSIKSLAKIFKLLKTLKNWGLKGSGTSYEQRFYFLDHQSQNMSPKLRKSSRIGQERKRWCLLFRKFWLQLPNVFFSFPNFLRS